MKRSKGRLIAIVIADPTVIATAVTVGRAPRAHACTATGCKWPSSTLRVDTRSVHGTFSTAIRSAISNYSGSTQLTMSYTNTSGPTFTAKNALYGNTGWEGYTNWNCPFGSTWSAHAKLNQTYLGGASAGQDKIVWLHELGHGLGLNHVSGITRVMYKSASDAYFSGGVRSLTTDEINGINALY